MKPDMVTLCIDGGGRKSKVRPTGDIPAALTKEAGF